MSGALGEIVASRRVLFVGGKGGVGKTTCAAAIALSQARAGRRVLLVSTDPAHSLGHLWGRRIGPEPAPLAPLLHAVEIDPDAIARAHMRQVEGTLRELVPEHLRGEAERYARLAADAPGAHEAAMLERVAELVREGMAGYELVVFDTAPSGHTARLLTLPEAMGAWTEALLGNRRRASRFERAGRALGGWDPADGRGVLDGVAGEAGQRGKGWPGFSREERDHRIRRILLLRREKFEALRSALRDPAVSGFLIALTAARLPVLETIELRDRLADAGMGVAGYIVGKRAPADAGEFLAQRRAAEEEWMNRLRAEAAGVPIAEVSLFASDPLGEEGLERVAACLLGS